MNPFAALESDDEDDSFIKVQSNKKNSDSKKSTQAKQQVKQQAPTSAPSPAVTVSHSDKKAAGRGAGRGDTRSRGRGAGRGGKETGDRLGKTGKREYDRRSGTGRGTEVAKGGSGKGGWGSNEDEISAQRREIEQGGETVHAVEQEKAAEVVEEPVEPEVPTFTMDEFLAKRDAERSSSNSSIFQKVETRAVTDDFSSLKVKNTEQDAAFIVLGAGKTKTSNGHSQRSSDKAKVTDLGFHAAPKAEFREDRGGRGGGKGGKGGRGGDRRPAPRNPRVGGKVDINDTSAFPSL